jgi:ABC-type multidrug transport system ATPase subunit
MGASGAGKTTCLDVLAERKNIGIVSGDILVDGRPTGPDFARSTAYAEQMYVHEGTATVREAMRFSAYLRQPFHVPAEEKDAYVEEVIDLLELHDLADAIIDTLDVGACKRLTIGVELASKPGLLLFLDEPTSGLDAQNARDLIRVLRRLADQGQAILCTIHQPSSLLFESFDRLLLLENGGHTVYFGDIGPGSCVVREYLARHGAACPHGANPAEYMLDAIGAGTSPRIGHHDWKDIWLDSPEFQHVKEEIREVKISATSRNSKMTSKCEQPNLDKTNDCSFQNRRDTVPLPTGCCHEARFRHHVAFSWLHFHATHLAHLHRIVCIPCFSSARKDPKRPSVPLVLDVLVRYVSRTSGY